MLRDVNSCDCHVILHPQTHEASAQTVFAPNLDQDQAKTQHLWVGSHPEPASVSSLPLLGGMRGLEGTLCHVGG